MELLHSVGVSCMVIRYTITVQSDLETSDFGFLFLPAHSREIPSDGLALCNEKAENEFGAMIREQWPLCPALIAQSKPS